MASYFDEHDCQPLEEGETPNHLLQLARLMIDGGFAREWELEYQDLQGGKPAPPASKDSVKNLKSSVVSPAQALDVMKCPVCLGEYDEGETIKEMPCQHHFHVNCIIPWLEKTNSCPVCRYELPTDDQDYEELKKQKKRQKQREYELETLHSSMFG